MSREAFIDKIRNRRLSMAGLVKNMQPQKHYHTDPEGRNVFLTDEGAALAEEKLGCGNLYDEENTNILTALNCAVHAEALLARDRDYIVRKGESFCWR